MDESVLVRVRGGAGDLGNIGCDAAAFGFVFRWLSAPVRQRAAGHPSTGDKEKPGFFAGGINRDDAGVVEFAESLCFGHEAGAVGDPTEAGIEKDLEGDFAVGSGLEGEPDFAAGTAADSFANSKATKFVREFEEFAFLSEDAIEKAPPANAIGNRSTVWTLGFAHHMERSWRR